MINRLDWLHYDALFSVIRAHGFTEEPIPGGTLFLHPSGAELAFPPKDPNEPVIGYHYGGARAVLTNYGIMTRDAFELAVLQAAHRTTFAESERGSPAQGDRSIPAPV